VQEIKQQMDFLRDHQLFFCGDLIIRGLEKKAARRLQIAMMIRGIL